MTIHLSGWDLVTIVVAFSVINPFVEALLKSFVEDWQKWRERKRR